MFFSPTHPGACWNSFTLNIYSNGFDVEIRKLQFIFVMNQFLLLWGLMKEIQFSEVVREGVKKKPVKKRPGWPLGLTPSLPRSGQENVKFFDFYFWLYILIIYDSKRILPQKNIFWPLTPPCSPTHPPKSHLETFHDIHGFSCLGTVKRASKMHFSASSQWSKICFGYQWTIFNG